MSIDGKSAIRVYHQSLTGGLYTDILDDTLLLVAQRLYRNGKFTYVQDNDLTHTATHIGQHAGAHMKESYSYRRLTSEQS